MPRKRGRPGIDISGMRFGALVAIEPTEQRARDRQFYWRCRCDCGLEKRVLLGNLRSGTTKSCGCQGSRRLLSQKVEGRCETCGVSVTTRRVGRRKRYCSDRCRPKVSKASDLDVRTCRHCGASFAGSDASRMGHRKFYCSARCSSRASGKTRNAGERLKRRAKLAVRNCAGCGEPFRQTHGHQLRCRKGCGRVAIARCAGCGAERRSKSEVCRSCRHSSRRRMAPCPRCGRKFWPWADGVSHARKFCADPECAAYHRNRLAAIRSAAAEAARALRRRTATCDWCRAEFHTLIPTKRFCSGACLWRANASVKKARRRGAPGVLPSVWEIYARDKGVCQLCKSPVPRQHRPPHPLAATRDHIVPVRHGGSNDIVNIQLAHFKCNTSKGIRKCGSQLRLV